jgi:hypothetical protein
MEQLKRWADNGCMYVHILSARLPFCQRISRSRQAPGFHNRVRDPSVVASFSLKAHATVIIVTDVTK